MNKRKISPLFHQGEDLAVKYLMNKGYDIIARNYRVRSGEIDIIASTSDTLVFIEVKTRSKPSLKQALLSISEAKIKHMTQTAQAYILRCPDFVKPRIRFDFIILLYFPHTDTYSIDHYENAFFPQDD